METPPVTPEMVKIATLILCEGCVREGLIVLPDLTDEQVEEELRKHMVNFCRSENFESALTFDHTEKLLDSAKEQRDQHELELACLFYMLWIEHQINLILRIMMRRRKTNEGDAVAAVRRLSIRDKLSWFWKMLDLEPLREEVVADTFIIEEFRNGFVHFKWQSYSGFEHEERAWRAVSRMDDIVESLKAIEERYVFYGQRQRLKDIVGRLKDV